MSEKEKKREDWQLIQTTPGTILDVRPDSVIENIIVHIFSPPVGEQRAEAHIEGLVGESERKIIEASENILKALLSGNRRVSQMLVTAIDRKTLSASMRITLNAALTDASIVSESLRAEIKRLLDRAKSPNVPDDERTRLYERIHELSMASLGLLRSITRLVKDVESFLNLNLPFDKKSDLFRSLTGYTASSGR